MSISFSGRVSISARLNDAADCLADFPCHIGIIHGVQVNAVHPVGHQVDDLVDGIGNAGIPERIRIVLETLYHLGKLPGQTCAAHGDHALDLFPVGHRHNASLNGNIHAGTGSTIAEVVERIIVEKQLGDEMACAGIHLFLQMADVRIHVGRLRVALRIAGARQCQSCRPCCGCSG